MTFYRFPYFSLRLASILKYRVDSFFSRNVRMYQQLAVAEVAVSLFSSKWPPVLSGIIRWILCTLRRAIASGDAPTSHDRPAMTSRVCGTAGVSLFTWAEITCVCVHRRVHLARYTLLSFPSNDFSERSRDRILEKYHRWFIRSVSSPLFSHRSQKCDIPGFNKNVHLPNLFLSLSLVTDIWQTVSYITRHSSTIVFGFQCVFSFLKKRFSSKNNSRCVSQNILFIFTVYYVMFNTFSSLKKYAPRIYENSLANLRRSQFFLAETSITRLSYSSSELQHCNE